MLVESVIFHGAISQQGTRDEIETIGEVGTFYIKVLLNHKCTGLAKVHPVNLDFNSHCMVFLVTLVANGDMVSAEMGFDLGGLSFQCRMNDGVDGVATVEVGGHLVDEADRGNIKSHTETMGMEEEMVAFEPDEETSIVVLQVTDGLVTANVDEKTEVLDHLVGLARDIFEATEVLSDSCFISGDVTSQHGTFGHGEFINREDHVGQADLLEFLEEVHERRKQMVSGDLSLARWLTSM